MAARRAGDRLVAGRPGIRRLLAIGSFGAVYRRINKVMGWGKLEGDLWEIKLSKIYSTPARARG